MSSRSIATPIIVATVVCGTLDILFATILTVLRGKDVAAMLRFVASGPFPGAAHWGAAGSLLGLAVHFTLMAMMVAVSSARVNGLLIRRRIGRWCRRRSSAARRTCS